MRLIKKKQTSPSLLSAGLPELRPGKVLTSSNEQPGDGDEVRVGVLGQHQVHPHSERVGLGPGHIRAGRRGLADRPNITTDTSELDVEAWRTDRISQLTQQNRTPRPGAQTEYHN